ncbi:Ger(x)C family spore germination protein [Paenibacillus psychroresistens]|uniref:Ger(X)C family spore germination protein n=1 Tax=Paenibacillus psychroresistens TaxID=1778678 RepID=A0A6B8RLA3_9BACL|nr:Ger(x)C family spore germination protein [Paenibacillus psychroresistens]QGQ96819.1 Ger(x)C family spore germination protein [Paenibacillus psychroresistens]
MRLRIALAFSSLILLLMTGCWNRAELDEYSFVQAVAIDKSEQENIKMTTHFYKPNGGGGDASGSKTKSMGSSLNIQTEGENIFDAIRDITLHLGRKSKWDHNRVILVSEEIIKQQNIAELLDLFIRDHEPRPTTYILVTKGEASDYLELPPYIENTLGQQFRSMDQVSYQSSAKVIKATILDLEIQMKSPTGIALLPTLYLEKKHKKEPAIAGIVLLEKGKLIDSLPASEVRGLLMLTNKMKGAAFSIPCEGKVGGKIKKDAFELSFINSKIKTSIKKDAVDVHIALALKGSAGELVCSSLITEQDEAAFEKRVSDLAKKEMQQVITHLQDKKIDALGIGNKIFAKNPKTWLKWQKDWNERFAEIHFSMDVKVEILHTGSSIGKPSSQ